MLLLMTSLKKWQLLGETRDDAVGEAYDKVAKMLGLPYPGGPIVEQYAKNYGSGTSIVFPRPMIHETNYDFSFSGLKTAVLYYLRDNFSIEISNIPNIKNKKNIRISDIQKICASFQQAAIDVLVHKTMRAVEEFGAISVLLCGGVAANKNLQKKLKAASSKLKDRFFVPLNKYNGDNATMIAAAAHLGTHHPTEKPLPNLSL